MSLSSIQLRNALQLLYGDTRLRTKKLRENIRGDIKRASGESTGSGDFHSPFWADAKKHVLGTADLAQLANSRIAKAKGKARLYPELAKGFLSWWNNKRRWRNEPLTLLRPPANAQLQLPELGIVIRVENVMLLGSGAEFRRAMYPYFSETPALSNEAARLGIWVMTEALRDQEASDMRILDVMRGASLGTLDVPLEGNERDIFVRKYAKLLEDWEVLRRTY